MAPTLKIHRPDAGNEEAAGQEAAPAPAGLPARWRLTARRRRGRADFAAAEAAASAVRGAMIDRLDAAYCDGRLGGLLGRDSDCPRVRERSMSLFQEVQVVLFPEEFLDPPEPRADPGPAGILPPGGGRCGGRRRLETLARLLTAARAAA